MRLAQYKKHLLWRESILQFESALCIVKTKRYIFKLVWWHSDVKEEDNHLTEVVWLALSWFNWQCKVVSYRMNLLKWKESVYKETNGQQWLSTKFTSFKMWQLSSILLWTLSQCNSGGKGSGKFFVNTPQISNSTVHLKFYFKNQFKWKSKVQRFWSRVYLFDCWNCESCEVQNTVLLLTLYRSL